MKNVFLKLILICSFIFLLNSETFAYQIKADATTKRVLKGSKIEVMMVNDVRSEALSNGDMFSAYVTKDIKVDDVVVIPMGSLIRGNTVEVTRSKRLSKSATLLLHFNHLVAPNGNQIPMAAFVCSTFKLTDLGAIDGGGNYLDAVKETANKSGKIVKNATNWGIESGEALFTGGKYLVTPISATGGAIAGSLYFVGDSIADLFKKGKEIIIPKRQKFDIILTEPIDVPII